MTHTGHMGLALCTAAVLLVAGCPLAATAGAWKRPVDTGFASTSITLRRTDQGLVTDLGYYRDFGHSDHFDLGLDLNQTGTQSGHALLFARLPLRQGANQTQISTELALGANHANSLWHPMYRITLSAGHSKHTRQGTLWGNLDLTLEHRGGTSQPLWKLDGAFGLDSARRISPLLQIETSFGTGHDFGYAITPSLRIHLSDFSILGKQHFKNSDLTIGLEYRSLETHSLGLKIALWRRF